MTERKRNVLAVIPLNLDGYLLSSNAKPVLSRLGLGARCAGGERDSGTTGG